MAFKPDRELLNAKFEGYKLAKQPLSCISQSFGSGVRVARLNSQDYSYQHVRAYTLYNHLAGDPWDERSVYWCDGNGCVQRGSYKSSGELHISNVYTPTVSLATVEESANPSMLFLSPHLCLLANGSGSLLLLHTGGGGGEQGRGKEWKLVEEIQLEELDSKFFSLLTARYVEGTHQLDILSMILGDPNASVNLAKHNSVKKPPIASYYWHRVQVEFDSTNTDVSTKLPCGVGKGKLCCSFGSATVALYTAVMGNRILFLNEADLVPLNGPTGESQEGEDEGEKVEEEKGEVEGKEEQSKMEIDGEEEEEGGERSRKHKGLGFHPESEPEPQYKWNQTESDITIVVMLSQDVTKADIDCQIDRKEVVVGLTDGTTFVRGQLFAPIDTDSSTWTIENHVLEVSLEKQQSGVQWPSLTAQQPAAAAGLPPQCPATEELTAEELKELEKKISEEAPQEEDGTPAAKRHHAMVETTTYEECDQTEGEDATVFILEESGHIASKIPLSGRKYLFSASPTPHSLPLLSFKHDVDAVLWQPHPPTDSNSMTTTSDPKPQWTHVSTFNALAYIQVAKNDRKFTTCPPNFSYAVVTDCDHHVFIYMQPREGVIGNAAEQYVTTLGSVKDIFGLHTTNSGLVYVLSDGELTVIVVSSNST